MNDAIQLAGLQKGVAFDKCTLIGTREGKNAQSLQRNSGYHLPELLWMLPSKLIENEKCDPSFHESFNIPSNLQTRAG